MNIIKVFPIGKIENTKTGVCVRLDKKFAPGLKGLKGFSHIQILWWADCCDNDKDRATLTEKNPYRKGPEEVGVFAMRSPERPNPVAISNAEMAFVDEEGGTVGLFYVDAFDGTQVIDLKPYTPAADRIENPSVPDWCSHWPDSYEKSGSFDWQAEFSFQTEYRHGTR